MEQGPWEINGSLYSLRSDTGWHKKRELLKTLTEIEDIQEKKKYWQKLNNYNLPFKRQ